MKPRWRVFPVTTQEYGSVGDDPTDRPRSRRLAAEAVEPVAGATLGGGDRRDDDTLLGLSFCGFEYLNAHGGRGGEVSDGLRLPTIGPGVRACGWTRRQ